MGSNPISHTDNLPLSSPLISVPATEQPTPSPHPMQTRSRCGIHKPNPRYADLHALTPIPSEPKSIKSALKHPGWSAAMEEELDALAKNHTWELVPKTEGMNIVGCKWVYKTKLKADSTLERLKARLVAKGFSQVDGVDFTETFSPAFELSLHLPLLNTGNCTN
ncbi:hypothetical protein F2P56_030734 [Juglans regia]|uniref:Reverse transcriptase Ty1/copia-type domain-containing protein n=2 Tax=Juglans regia TaxID=51240 RepID=A0A833T0G5_JUGRE|nr:uncharacterized mitochondrial protein AtMg00820-like [Juglans regia]KAF5450376.1 hypothetical protein F2P56_030734 [Juglans regia]